jgi:hypothetical protein
VFEAFALEIQKLLHGAIPTNARVEDFEPGMDTFEYGCKEIILSYLHALSK